MVDYIREFCRAKNKCLIRTNSQGKSAAHLLKLLKMARRDFKDLDENAIMLIRIRNEHKNQSYAWEFTPTRSVPKSYKIIDLIPRLVEPSPPIDDKLLLEAALP